MNTYFNTQQMYESITPHGGVYSKEKASDWPCRNGLGGGTLMSVWLNTSLHQQYVYFERGGWSGLTKMIYISL